MTGPLAVLLQDLAWKLDAACKGQSNGPDSPWFVFGRQQPPKEIQLTCARCPVRTECLEYILRLEGGAAITNRSHYWAGTTPADRGRIHRQRKQQKRLPHPPEEAICACGCGQTFDAWRTFDGKPRRSRRHYATKECAYRVIHDAARTRPRTAICAGPECTVEFNPFTSFTGELSRFRNKRKYHSPECQARGVAAAQAARKQKP